MDRYGQLLSKEFLTKYRILIFIEDNGEIIRICEICSKLTIQTPERRRWHVVMEFSLLTLKINAGWDTVSL